MTPPRDDIETTTPVTHRRCPVDGTLFVPVRRQHYCSPACRQAAWRARHNDPVPAARADTSPPARRRKDVTVYTCPDCEERYLGEQWCFDCNRPCIRTGVGGLCPACDHPVALDDLLPQHQDQVTHEPKIR